jgi:hypothetical protein
MNVTHCFLCASLQCPLLAAVPINFYKPTLTSMPDTPTRYSPLLSIPLWEPEPNQHPFPFHTCYFTQHFTLKVGLHGLCHSNIPVTSQIFLSSGLSFWCNGTLYAYMNTTIPGPCLLVVIIPQLTLFGEAELTWLLLP